MLFEYIRSQILSTGRGPSFSEMRAYMKVASNQAILDLLIRIEKRGYVERKHGHRNINLTDIGRIYTPSKIDLLNQTQISTARIEKPSISSTSLGTIPVYFSSSLISNVIQPFSKGGDTDGSS